MKIGIIGGGQLGMMMAEEAIPLGHEIISLDPNPHCPLSHYASTHITAAYDDVDALQKLYTSCDVITYEFENVDFNLVHQFENKIPQKSKALYITKNRLREKTFVRDLGISAPEFYKFEGSIKQAPCVIKTTQGGYDGKGQYYINDDTDMKKLTIDQSKEYIVEEYIDYDYEISVVITRDQFDNMFHFPITQNIHRNGILYRSITYVPIHNEVLEKAIAYSKQIIHELDYVGTLAVEYFVKDKNVIFNEYAPRPHNSGHYTIEGTTVSQFKNHILAITGEKIIQPSLIAHSEMINVLGQDMNYLKRATADNVYVHMYHKDKVVTNRKMGHITIFNKKI